MARGLDENDRLMRCAGVCRCRLDECRDHDGAQQHSRLFLHKSRFILLYHTLQHAIKLMLHLTVIHSTVTFRKATTDRYNLHSPQHSTTYNEVTLVRGVLVEELDDLLYHTSIRMPMGRFRTTTSSCVNERYCKPAGHPF